jgi:hypothetical protein
MTEITDLSPTDSSNTSVTGESLDGSIANMGRMDNTLQAILGMFGRWTSSDTIASAGTTDIGAQAEAYLTVSGTTTITSFGTVRAGTIRFLRFSGILTLTYNATSLILPGAASITTAVGDTAVFVSEGSGNWRCISYQRGSESPYAEGIFTPTILGLTTAGTTTYTTQTGRFTRVGRMVMVEVILVWTSATGTGQMAVGGLPFQPALTSATAAIYSSGVSASASSTIVGLTSSATPIMPLYNQPVGGGTATSLLVDSAGELRLSLTYSV